MHRQCQPLRVPGSAAAEPQVQSLCAQLHDRLCSPAAAGDLTDDDWEQLSLCWQLHAKSLALVDAQEAREYRRAARLASGWWEAAPSESSLQKVLVRKALAEAADPNAAAECRRALRLPGVFVLSHCQVAAFTFAGVADSSQFDSLRRLLTLALDGGRAADSEQPLLAALLLTQAADWRLAATAAEPQQLRLSLQNELVLLRDCLYPRGLNVSLNQSAECLELLPALRRRLAAAAAAGGGGDDGERQLSSSEAVGGFDAPLKSLADLQFGDVARLVFEADTSQLFACSDEVRRFAEDVAALLRRRRSFRRVDVDACRRLRDAVARIADKSDAGERLRYRRCLRRHSRWWGDHPDAFGHDAVASLDHLAEALALKVGVEASPRDSCVRRLQVPGLLVLRHRRWNCWRFVAGPSDDVLRLFRRLLHLSFDGEAQEEEEEEEGEEAEAKDDHLLVSALLFLTVADDWELQLCSEEDQLARTEAFNELVLADGCLWPHGANRRLLQHRRALPALRLAMLRHPPPDCADLDEDAEDGEDGQL